MAIPLGVVIDLGSATPRSGTHKKPMWFVPTPEAQCWLPSQSFLSTWPNRNAGTPFQTCDEVGTVMAPLNVPHPDNC